MAKNHEDMKLKIEYIASENHGVNVRSIMTQEEWDILRRHCYQRANYTCEICGGKGSKWPVECHEVWEYNIKKGKQILIKLQALCTLCHLCKHLGRAIKIGRGKEALKHFRKVNRIRTATQERVIQEARHDFFELEGYSFDVDISHAKQLLKQLMGETRKAKKLPNDMTKLFKKGGKRL